MQHDQNSYGRRARLGERERRHVSERAEVRAGARRGSGGGGDGEGHADALYPMRVTRIVANSLRVHVYTTIIDSPPCTSTS